MELRAVALLFSILSATLAATIISNGEIEQKSKNPAEVVARVKRGYAGHSTGIAYNRINDQGQLRTVGPGHRGGDGHEYDGEEEGDGVIGEDGTHTTDFKSHGTGYEHHHGGHCEESKCGYNIRHCPHGCVFNSFLCGGGAAYDTCCC